MVAVERGGGDGSRVAAGQTVHTPKRVGVVGAELGFLELESFFAKHQRLLGAAGNSVGIRQAQHAN